MEKPPSLRRLPNPPHDEHRVDIKNRGRGFGGVPVCPLYGDAVWTLSGVRPSDDRLALDVNNENGVVVIAVVLLIVFSFLAGFTAGNCGHDENGKFQCIGTQPVTVVK